MAAEFDIPLGNQRGLFGVFLAAHAINDALHLMYTGVGCKPKAQRQIAHHDLCQDAGNKMVWADIGEREIISGPLERLENLTLETVRRRGQVGVIFISGSASAELLGADLRQAVERIKRRVRCPVIYLPGDWEEDHFLAYARAMREVLRLVRWNKAPKKPRRINLIGNFFDRHEEDRDADTMELLYLCLSGGFHLHTLFFSGHDIKELQKAWQAEVNVVLPYYPLSLHELQKLSGRPALRVDLPLGPAACRRFVEQLQLGITGKVEPPRQMTFHRLDTERVLASARRRLGGKRILVLAESPVAAGLVELLSELEMEVPLVALLDQSLGGREYFLGKLKEYGVAFSSGRVLENPSWRELQGAAEKEKLKNGRLFDIIVAPDIWLPREITAGAARLELGFPSNRRHVFSREPVLGWGGVRMLAQRLLAASEGVF